MLSFNNNHNFAVLLTASLPVILNGSMVRASTVRLSPLLLLVVTPLTNGLNKYGIICFPDAWNQRVNVP